MNISKTWKHGEMKHLKIQTLKQPVPTPGKYYLFSVQVLQSFICLSQHRDTGGDKEAQEIIFNIQNINL